SLSLEGGERRAERDEWLEFVEHALQIEVRRSKPAQAVPAGLVNLFALETCPTAGYASTGCNLRRKHLDSSLDDVNRAIDAGLFIRLRSKLETAETDARDRDTARAECAQLHLATCEVTIRRFRSAH